MWDMDIKAGQNPLDALNSSLFDPAPKTGMKFRGAARKSARNPKVSERDGQTYVKTSLGEGARFNNKGEYRVSQTEAKRIKAENNAVIDAANRKKRREDMIIAEMLAEQAELMAQYNKTSF